MSFVAVAIGAGAVLAAGATIYASNKSADAAQNAADAQVQSTQSANDAQVRAQQIASDTQLTAQDRALAFQQQALDTQRSDLAPFRAAGLQATEQLSRGTQPGGELTGDVPYTPPAVPAYRPFTLADFQQDPSYKFRVAEGLKAIDRSASARGTLLSGRTLKEAQRYGQDAASQEYQAAYGRHTTDYQNQLAGYDRNASQATERFNVGNVNLSNKFNRLASVAGTGQTSAQQLAQATGQAGAANAGLVSSTGQNIASGQLQLGQNQANNLINAGNARASGYVGSANAINNGVSNLAGIGTSLAQYQLLSSLLNRTPGAIGGGGTL
jgi:hypothetical protein